MSSGLEPNPMYQQELRLFKTYEQIVIRYRELVSGNASTARDELRVELLAYYKSPQGKEDIRVSPHFSRTPEEVTALVMQTIPIIREV